MQVQMKIKMTGIHICSPNASMNEKYTYTFLNLKGKDLSHLIPLTTAICIPLLVQKNRCIFQNLDIKELLEFSDSPTGLFHSPAPGHAARVWCLGSSWGIPQYSGSSGRSQTLAGRRRAECSQGDSEKAIHRCHENLTQARAIWNGN